MVNFNLHSLLTVAVAILPFAVALPAPAPPSFSTRAGSVVADNYIIVLKSEITAEQFEAHQLWATGLHNKRRFRRNDESLSGIKRKYNFGKLTGYSGSFDSATIGEIKAHGDVAFVEEDKIVVAHDMVDQPNAPWGIARISHKSVGGVGGSELTYRYDSSGGEGITAYVIDTGVNIAHEEFEGRAVFGYNVAGGPNDDGQGHGTHVSGTIAGRTYGVAKKASIVAVKVLDDQGEGTNSNVIAGVEWVWQDAQRKGSASKSVANMSLGGTFSQALNQAVEVAIEAGITFGVAAGNDGLDAANYSPASVSAAITVGATDITDTRAKYSNIGSFVDVFAPGTNITSAWIGSNDASRTISGTSMATPHVVGLAAYLMALEGLGTPSAVLNRIQELAVDGMVADPGTGTANQLIYNGADL